MKPFIIIFAISTHLIFALRNSLEEANELLNNDLIMNGIQYGNGHKTTISKLQTEVLNKIKDPRTSYSSNGFINLNLMQRSLPQKKLGDQFRFLRGPSRSPDPDEIMNEKLGLSNGIILYGNRRTINFASDGIKESPFVDAELQKIELMDKNN